MYGMWHFDSRMTDQGEQSYCQAAIYPIANIACVHVTSQQMTSC